MSSSDYNNLLGKIQNLQSVQKRLHAELNSLPPNSNFERQQLLITQIDNINSQKIALFKNLYSLNHVLQDEYNASASDLQARTEMLQMVDEQLKATQQRLREQRNQNINNLRMTQINNYYSGYYAIYLKVFRYIIYTSIFIVIIVFLRQRYILSAGATNGLAFIIIAIGGFFIFSTLFDLNNRNNMVISEYDFPAEPDTKPEHANGDSDSGMGVSGAWVNDLNRWKKDMQLLAEGECLGPACCVGDGLTFDKKKMVCKLDPGKATKKEGFTSGANLSPANIDDANVALITPSNNNYYTNN
jgi:hypothetical protein